MQQTKIDLRHCTLASYLFMDMNMTTTTMAMRRKNTSRATATTTSSTLLLLVVLAATVLLPPGHHGFQAGNTFLLPTKGATTTGGSTSPHSSTKLHFFFADKEEKQETAASPNRTSNNKAKKAKNAAKNTPKPKPSPTTTMERYKKNQTPSFSFNPFYGIAWICLVIFAFSDNFAPGALGAPQDAALFQAILANPVHPDGINELFYCIFNFFAVIPVLLANIYIPQAQAARGSNSSNKGLLPAWPFIVASSAIGYFAMGIYLTLRATPPKQMYASNDTSWFVNNVLENKALNWALVAFTLYLPFGSHAVEQLLLDPQALWHGLVELETTSRVAAISTIDLTLLYISAVAGTGRDYRLRMASGTTADQQVLQVVAASALVPLLGTAIYCAVRPSLPLLLSTSPVAKEKSK